MSKREKKSSSSEKSVLGKNQSTPEIGYDELEFIEQIGEGCYGEVWRGKCRGQEVAIKKLHKQLLDAKTLNDFRKEVEIMSNNHHPNVVLFMGACTVPTKMVMVSELMKHGSVEDLIHAPNATDNVSLRQRIKILQDTAHGVNWLHCSDPQIVHRDLKPSNLLIDENWNVKVCDFGLSRIKAKSSPKFKDVDSIPGTPLWMAPEVMLSLELDEKTDIYSFGIVAWEVLSGGNPFEEYDDYDLFKDAICELHVRPPIPSTMPAPLATLLQQCWAASPKVRPSCAEVLRALDRAAIDCMISDLAARKFWHHNFATADADHDVSAVLWDAFAPAFAYLLGVPESDVEHSPTFKCIKALSATKSTDPTSRNRLVMTTESFGHLLYWFGPLDLKQPDEFLDRIANTVRKDWFHGDIDSATANSRLATAAKSSFLVRCSRKTAATEPFTLSRKTKEGIICHQRIAYSPSSATFSIVIKYKSKEKKDKLLQGKPHGSLDDFIRLIKPKLHLDKACKGSDFQSLFVSTQVLEGYM